MSDQSWYQKFRCRNCLVSFSQFPALLGCSRVYGVDLMRQAPDTGARANPEMKESNAWIRTHVLHPCSETENGIADLVGFTTKTPQVKEGGLVELRGDDLPAHLRR